MVHPSYRRGVPLDVVGGLDYVEVGDGSLLVRDTDVAAMRAWGWISLSENPALGVDVQQCRFDQPAASGYIPVIF